MKAMSSPRLLSGRVMKSAIERRTRNRVLLRFPVQLYRSADPDSFTGETRDLSSAGFYCLVREPVAQGDRLDCIITVPAANFSSQTGDVSLRCQVEVVRVDSLPAQFGVACRIDRYSVILRPEAMQ